MTWEPACMSAAEYALWREANERIPNVAGRATNPCRDCPVWFRTLSEDDGCCNREREPVGTRYWSRIRIPDTGDPKVDRERARWRRASQLRRARARGEA